MCFHEIFQVENSIYYFLDWPVAFSRENSMLNLGTIFFAGRISVDVSHQRQKW